MTDVLEAGGVLDGEAANKHLHLLGRIAAMLTVMIRSLEEGPRARPAIPSPSPRPSPKRKT